MNEDEEIGIIEEDGVNKDPKEVQYTKIDIEELERRVALFKPWAGENATKKFFEIVRNKIWSLQRRSARVPFYIKNKANGTIIPYPNRDGVISFMHGEIKMGEEMLYTVAGCMKSLETVKTLKQKQEQEGKNGYGK